LRCVACFRWSILCSIWESCAWPSPDATENHPVLRIFDPIQTALGKAFAIADHWHNIARLISVAAVSLHRHNWSQEDEFGSNTPMRTRFFGLLCLCSALVVVALCFPLPDKIPSLAFAAG